ncbi:hypothetical protein Sjap_002332 [Stephania japonica]|uniref:RNase H type-1 domain-containing protein n=1 Tax=Stephania japonica TaxID=461633 RepID=A0AAP0PSJ7_9MAGN
MSNLGKYSPFAAELRGVKKGLEWVEATRVERLIVEMDSKEVPDLLGNPTSQAQCDQLVWEIKGGPNKGGKTLLRKAWVRKSIGQRGVE